MKKIVSYMMTGILLLSFLLTGCGSPEPQTGKKMSMYYINTAETKVEVHEQYLDTKTLDEQLDETMRYLSTTPEKLEYKAPLDMGFRVLDYEVEDMQNYVLNGGSEEYLTYSRDVMSVLTDIRKQWGMIYPFE